MKAIADKKATMPAAFKGMDESVDHVKLGRDIWGRFCSKPSS